MLLERDKERALLLDLLAGVDSSGGKVVLVRGDAGIGKSALVRDFVDGVADDAHVLFGICDDLLTPEPLGPFWDISRDERPLSESLVSGDRMVVMGAILDLLSRSLRPTVLVIEDTHWADEATLDVIRFLGRRIGKANGLLVLTYRDSEVDYDHPLRRVIGDLPSDSLVRIRLEGLSEQAVAGLVGDQGFDIGEVITLTDGNPLFVTELVSSGGRGVPSSVGDSVLARAARLSIPARQILDLISVIPGETEQSLIDNLLTPTEEHVTESVRQGLLRIDPHTVSFHHELTRRAVESALSLNDRRRLNGLVLVELGGGGDFARLVHHAREAEDVEAIIQFAPKAGRAAMAAGSHREASGHFRTLEPYLDRIAEIDRAAIVDDWARSEVYLGTAESVDILVRAIALHRSTGADRALARALTLGVRVNESIGQPQTADACGVVLFHRRDAN